MTDYQELIVLARNAEKEADNLYAALVLLGRVADASTEVSQEPKAGGSQPARPKKHPLRLHWSLHLPRRLRMVENCGSQSDGVACCMPKGHVGLHQRPMVAWKQWGDPGAICGMVSQSGPNLEPLACGWKAGHTGKHAWSSLPSFVRATPIEEGS